jgi:hypothetical protein
MTNNRDGVVHVPVPTSAIPMGVVVLKGRRQGRPTEPKEPVSREAQRFAAGILEVLAGVRTPTDAAAAMGISVPRYYLWEQRALEGLVAACQPRGGGKIVSSRCQILALEKEVARLKQECARQQALVRAAQRTIGLAPPPAPKPVTKAGGKTVGKRARKRRRPAVRALKAVAALRATSAPADGGDLSGMPPSEVLQRSAVSNPSPPTTPACTDTVGG